MSDLTKSTEGEDDGDFARSAERQRCFKINCALKLDRSQLKVDVR